jgi:hypothetical protein
MPRSKTNLSKLPKALREPIEDGLPPPFLSDDETKAWVVQNAARLLSESLVKLYLLMDELGIPAELKDAARWPLLSLALARKLYPGFMTTLEARPKGRPRRGQRKAHAGGAYVPVASLSEPPELALALVDLLREIAPTDKAACEMLLKCEDRTLLSPARRTELARKTRSLSSVIATMRQGAKRKTDGKLN